ncbi:MAG: Eco57I restriction-modification methylase domain-containing protein [Chitinophagales bacterium]|nr:Eco57I restriction-modification methylase domain-containing protein [Chitinophagales bacterium]
MKLDILNPAKKLKASYQRLHIDREKIELFKENIKKAFEDIAIADKKKESEEHYKAIVRDFLLDTYYKGNHSINTQGRNDLVIHNGSNATSPVGIIIETKQPSNKSEMISVKSPNSKSFQQLITYFLKERFENKNLEIKHLIISNIYEWYIFDASDFERYFYDNKKIKDSYLDWTNKTSLMSKTDWFYKEVLFPHIEENLESIPCTYFNLKDYESIINNDNLEDDEALLDLYKILSSEHLLKKQIANDSNSLNKQFYAELLHILGLEEVKEGSKKTIKRCAKPNEGSILENTLAKLKAKARDVSETESYEIALELTITWLNRILFLKLLEGQLIKYNNNSDFAFLNYKKVNEYDVLEELFFEVLAVNYKERPESIQKIYGNIPYLNSSLFEETELERTYFGINVLKDRLDIPIYSNSVLNFQVKGSSKRTLEYLFEFLDAYDFGDESKGKIKENSKSIINASVLGLIFEKINGYKDGSFFTPSFITMYMCRESIRRAVVQKFNDTYGWNCEEFKDLKNEIKSIKKKEASDILNTLRICDPAVGSGHFLVSALNELITIKQDLKILIDSEGVDLSEYTIDIENDELVIKDERGIPYSYLFQKKESRRIQETLFREKQTIIENCLFGVDINPKSVMICRLRLWIELLKNAYYTESSKYKELETLPNIDINIKCGNSLISRFEVKDSVFESIPNFQTRLKEYTTWVKVYKGERDKSAKAQLVKKIDQFKSEFKLRDKRTDKVQNEMDKVTMEILKSKNPMFPLTDAEKGKVKDYEAKLEKLTQEKKDIESNPIYQNAFEWRFEFPEVLDENGGFIGFDVVIGNPPYIDHKKLAEISQILKTQFKIYVSSADISVYFFELGDNILNENGVLSFINTNKFFRTEYGSLLRGLISSKQINSIINFEQVPIFDEALVSSAIFIYSKLLTKKKIFDFVEFNNEDSPKENFVQYLATRNIQIENSKLSEKAWSFNDNASIIDKILSKGKPIKDIKSLDIKRGVTTGYDPAFIISNDILNEFKKNDIIKPLFKGANLKKYTTVKSTLSLIFTRKGYNIENDISIKNHLNRFYDDLKPKKENDIKGRKPGEYKWFEIQDNIAYYEMFEKDKIVWALTADKWGFALDTEKHYLSSGGFMMISESLNLKYLLAILNSNLMKFLFQEIGVMTAGGAYTLKKATIEEFPIIELDDKKQQPFIKLVDKILSLKKSNPEADTTDLEAEVDKLVYELYGLSEEEIAIIENK